MAVLGVLLYRRGRPAAAIPERPSGGHDRIVPEHALPKTVVFLHGLAALATLVLVIATLAAS